ncbi:MAG: NADH-quinone oxidoreductase subunit J, partial [Pseudomonadota bacterium]|nr:NADH-quinone oxidoreductase subunit J [Pseudomonadota bacterium]MEC7246214.1 NADH-quinone oxidoreductase subunit J [Pseudomonadota bacterium]
SLPSPGDVHNTKALGQVIYTDYIYLFQLAGLILLVAMIGAIALTLRKRTGVRKQVIADQNARTRSETVKLAKVETGAGVKEISQ